MSVLISEWFDVHEKSTALAIATTGNQLSVMIAMFATASLCQTSLFGGWPSAFYLYGLLGLVLSVLWQLIVRDRPPSRPSDMPVPGQMKDKVPPEVG